jgi:predicted N-acetyltransferase YhbS
VSRGRGGLVIREAGSQDHAAIHEVTLAAYEEYAARMPPPLWQGYRRNIVAALADPSPATQLVAEADGVVVGAVLLYPAMPDAQPARPWPEVRLLAVPPAARGRGIGAALMRECIRRARAAGATVLSLHTTDLMRVAKAMYERMGFVRAPELDFRPAPGVLIQGFRLDLARRPDSTADVH